MSSVIRLNLNQSKFLSSGNGLWTNVPHALIGFHPFRNKPWFLRVCSGSRLKTLKEKEKLLVTSNFSSSHSVSFPYGELPAIFIKFKIVVCSLSVWKDLKFVVWERVKTKWTPRVHSSVIYCLVQCNTAKTHSPDSSEQDWPTKIIDCLSDETLNRGPVWRCYTPSTLKNQAEFSVISSCILALSPVTTNRLLGASLRWATGSDDK